MKDITVSKSFSSEEVRKGRVVPLMEEFYTIQGEGFYTGLSAYFVRIGGCDVGCHWCDVKESWNPDTHPPTPIEHIVNNASKYSDTVVVTGGEPLTWDMTPLVSALQSEGMKVHVETSGAYPLTGSWDWICLSPKKTAPPKANYYDHANELKVIIHNLNDFKWAEQHAILVGEKCKLFLQPEWSKRKEMMPLIVDYVMKNPHWRVSLQTHKYLNIP